MLHFIVQAIEDKHRDLLTFSDEFYLIADGISKSESLPCVDLVCYLFDLVNILELQKQPQEINRELKNAREELTMAKDDDEPIEGDRFTDAIEVRPNVVGSIDVNHPSLVPGFHHTCRR